MLSDAQLMNPIIECLFLAVENLLNIRNLKIIVALRTNIFSQLAFRAFSHGGARQKFEGLCIHTNWNPQRLQYLLDCEPRKS